MAGFLSLNNVKPDLYSNMALMFVRRSSLLCLVWHGL